MIQRIGPIKADHPFWGYRRVWATLRFVHGLPVNKKRVERVMREAGLGVAPNGALRAKRTPTRSKPRPDRPNQWWGIDMTKVMVGGLGWLYIVIVLDWYSRKVVGHCAAAQSKSRHWMAAVQMAAAGQFPVTGIREAGVHLMSDNGSQPTSVSFMADCFTLGITQAFTSYNNPKGNANTERMMRTLKEELLWLHEWKSERELQDALATWIEHYNNHYLHSALKWKTPIQAEQDYLNKGPTSSLIAA